MLRYNKLLDSFVAPYVGAWIETIQMSDTTTQSLVAPYVGAWIETDEDTSLLYYLYVAPYVGAWIETLLMLIPTAIIQSRTLCGCVD